ncbi:MAG: TRAP transporter large permease [Peptococcaceae bacterium]|nr:TRAP transporter large permease [Peptococcaceae bacterium]
MSPETVGVIGIGVLLVLVFMRVWIGFAMALVGVAGYIYLDGWAKGVNMVGTEPFSQVADLTLTTVPLFILMGAVLTYSGLGKDLYETASKWIGGLRGGLAVATVAACAAFAAVCGHTTATAITIGNVALPQMKRFNYDTRLAVGPIVAGGTIGIMIPPSVAFILYGLLTQESIGKLFIAGFIPGILQAVFYFITIFIICRIKPEWGPAAEQRISLREKIYSLRLSGPVALIFLLVIGGIYIGVFTPTEAGACGAAAAMAVSFAARRLKWQNFRDTILETVMTTAMIIGMVVGAFIFMRFLAVSRLPAMLSDAIVALGLSKTGFILMIVALYLILGCFLDIFAAVILTVPVLYPSVVALGYDPIWFGVIVVRVIEIGLISPPIGMDVFAVSGALNVPMGTVFRGVAPFILSDLAHLALLIAVPDIALFLLK